MSTKQSPPEGMPLNWAVFETAARSIVTDDLTPHTDQKMTWPPSTSTLIFGETDAILIDALTTADQAAQLSEWVASHGRKLKYVYITHGHGDHFFGLGTLLGKFPGAKGLTKPEVIPFMQLQGSPEVIAAFWNKRFPGELPKHIAFAEPFDGDVLTLEGQDIQLISAGHSDTDNTTCLYVPSIGLLVAGDVTYNDVHIHLGESTVANRLEWLATLDKMDELSPQWVVSGHSRPGRAHLPSTIEETRQYIRDFHRLVEETPDALQLFDRMLELHPGRLNPGTLWASARAIKAKSNQ